MHPPGVFYLDAIETLMEGVPIRIRGAAAEKGRNSRTDAPEDFPALLRCTRHLGEIGVGDLCYLLAAGVTAQGPVYIPADTRSQQTTREERANSNPVHPELLTHHVTGISVVFGRRREEAVPFLNRAVKDHPRNNASLLLAGALAHLGRLEEAHEAIKL